MLKRSIRWAAMGATALTFVGLMAAGIAGLHHMANATAPVEAVPPVPVHAETVTSAPGYTVHERFVGRLEPARQTRLGFERSGLVTHVLVEEGDIVEKGQPVARLDTAKLLAERGVLDAKRRELEAQMRLAELTVERKKRLMDTGHGSVEQHDEARFGLARFVAAIENIDASIESLDVDIEKSVLRAPFAGRVGERLMDEGTVASPNLPVIHLLEAERRQVRIGVSVEASSKLTRDRTYSLSAAGRAFSAKLVVVRPDLSTSTRTVSAVFDVEGAEHLPFGEVMELALDRHVSEPGVWVPLAALVEGRKGLWTVYTVAVADGERVVKREAVEILHAERARAFVRGTLASGAQIVLNGTNRVVPGQRVAVAH
jgi:RND family efflux transporter MFP subunit